MRAAVLAILAATGAGTPPPGVYCPVGGERMPIVIGPEKGSVGIDGLDCQDAVVSGGRLRATRCDANGGSVVPYDTTLNLLPDGDLVHEMEIYRLTPKAPCD